MNINEFWKELARHDWSYRRSDDMNAFDKGQRNEDRLTTLAHENDEEWQNLYKDWVQHINFRVLIPAYRGFDIVFRDANSPEDSMDWGIFKTGDDERPMIDSSDSFWGAVKLIDENMDIVDTAFDSPINKMMSVLQESLCNNFSDDEGVL